jgi:hypothetical protein
VEAQKLTRKYRPWILEQKVVTRARFDRMKAVELFSELLMSEQEGFARPIDRQRLDQTRSLQKAVREFKATMNMVRKKFPRIVDARLRNSAEFYSLFMLLWRMRQSRLVLKDRRADQMANHLLSTGVDSLRAHLRRASLPKNQDEVFRSICSPSRATPTVAQARTPTENPRESSLVALSREG